MTEGVEADPSGFLVSNDSIAWSSLCFTTVRGVNRWDTVQVHYPSNRYIDRHGPGTTGVSLPRRVPLVNDCLD